MSPRAGPTRKNPRPLVSVKALERARTPSPAGPLRPLVLEKLSGSILAGDVNEDDDNEHVEVI